MYRYIFAALAATLAAFGWLRYSPMRRAARMTTLIALVIAASYLWWACKNSDLAHLQAANSLAQTLGVIAAAGWFAMRAWLGHFYSAVRLTLSVERRRKNQTDDFVAGTLTIASGDHGGAIQLHDIFFGVSTDKGVAYAEHYPQPQYDRRAVDRTLIDGRLRVDWDRTDPLPLLNLGPGDCMQFAFFTSIQAETPCLIQACVVTRGAGGTRYPGQWRASAVALPNRPI